MGLQDWAMNVIGSNSSDPAVIVIGSNSSELLGFLGFRDVGVIVIGSNSSDLLLGFLGFRDLGISVSRVLRCIDVYFICSNGIFDANKFLLPSYCRPYYGDIGVSYLE